MRLVAALLIATMATTAQAAPVLDLAALLKQAPVPAEMTSIPVQPTACCKHCSKGKPCGDSCIARNKECHKGPGCAC
ncbi:hypothetical protein [Afifella aestuarii]|uniref:hypothetical protein n=1 Tax=Afifella aestuarii TaxID=1909496 RepID=UPI000FE3E43C|nr:hypothetical protein [Afifella aestuarii]